MKSQVKNQATIFLLYRSTSMVGPVWVCLRIMSSMSIAFWINLFWRGTLERNFKKLRAKCQRFWPLPCLLHCFIMTLKTKNVSRNHCKLMSCNASKGITNNVTQLWGINLKLYHSNILAWHFYLIVQWFFWVSQIKLGYDYTHLLQSKSGIVESNELKK